MDWRDRASPSAVRMRVVRTRFLVWIRQYLRARKIAVEVLLSWEGAISLRKRSHEQDAPLHLLRDLLYHKFDSFTMPIKEEIKDRGNF